MNAVLTDWLDYLANSPEGNGRSLFATLAELGCMFLTMPSLPRPPAEILRYWGLELRSLRFHSGNSTD